MSNTLTTDNDPYVNRGREGYSEAGRYIEDGRSYKW